MALASSGHSIRHHGLILGARIAFESYDESSVPQACHKRSVSAAVNDAHPRERLWLHGEDCAADGIRWMLQARSLQGSLWNTFALLLSDGAGEASPVNPAAGLCSIFAGCFRCQSARIRASLLPTKSTGCDARLRTRLFSARSVCSRLFLPHLTGPLQRESCLSVAERVCPPSRRLLNLTEAFKLIEVKTCLFASLWARFFFCSLAWRQSARKRRN